MTAWAQKVWSEASGDKTALIRAAMATLSSGTRSEFAKLPPTIMASLATAWVLARPCDGATGEAVLQAWLRRYKIVQGIPSSLNGPSASKEPGPAVKELLLQFIVVGCTAGYQYTVIEGLCKMLA